MSVWLQFAACALVITMAGAKLSKYGDVIAEKTGLGRAWIGVVLMASVTSLLELITGISAVTVYDLPDIAVGDLLGSCIFNLLVIALMDFMCAGAPITAQANKGQALPAACGILLFGIVSTSLAAGGRIPAIGWIGLPSVFLFATYLISMRLTFQKTRQTGADTGLDAENQQYQNISRKRAYAMYTVSALFVVIAASWLPRVGDTIAEMTGLGHTFVGTFFIALSTVLPEVVVSFAALKIGAVNLALGNLLGSSLFNIAVLALVDFVFLKGPLVSHLSGNHAINAGAAIVLTSVVLIGITYGPHKKFIRLAWDSFAIILGFIASSWLLYLFG